MGLLDQIGGSLKGVLKSVAAGEQPALISALLAKTNLGDLQGLVNQLQQGGLGEQVKSWLSNGPNMNVTPEQLRAALNSDQLRQIAQHFGVPVDDALKMLSEHLPGIVDQASPNGTIERL
ncbi:MAG TPA: YidB family protein [Pseudolabrys sp.]